MDLDADDEKSFIGQVVNSAVGVVKEAIGKDYLGFVVEPIVV